MDVGQIAPRAGSGIALTDMGAGKRAGGDHTGPIWNDRRRKTGLWLGKTHGSSQRTVSPVGSI